MTEPKVVKILVVEDKVDLRRVYERIFKSHEKLADRTFVLLWAGTVEEAEERVKEHPNLDGVLLDASLKPEQEYDHEAKCMRPDFDVLMFLKVLRTRYPRLFIVATSSDADCNGRLVREGCSVGVPKAEAPYKLIHLLFPTKRKDHN